MRTQTTPAPLRQLLGIGILAAFVVLVVWTMIAVHSAPRPVPTAQPLPGDPAVYQRIARMSDCTALQAEFDTASTNHDRAVPGSDPAIVTSSYVSAVNDRMKAVGCY